MGDGRDLIDFYLAVFKGDAKALRTRRITLRDRIQAADWLAEQGWGKAPVVVDIPEEPQAATSDDPLAWPMPAHLWSVGASSGREMSE